MAAEDMVLGEGWISDESSFYGEEEEQDRLLALCDEFNNEPILEYHHNDLNAMLAKERSKPSPDLHNVYEGRFDSWQSHESVNDFVARLPPRTTTVSTCPWIWVANPYPEGREFSGGSHIQDRFIPLGKDLLQESLQKRMSISRQKLQNGHTTRLLNQESETLKQRISKIAEEMGILSGKWMLFPNLKDLTRDWELVVESTITNRLGSAAKVATEDDKEERLICVYTKDFRNTDDVFRVLNELVALGLVSSRGIYYKSDAYTYLDIYSKNQYGLQASLYSSQKMLAASITPQSKKDFQKK